MDIMDSSLESAIVWASEKIDWNNLGTCFRSSVLFAKPVMNSEDSNITYLAFSEIQAILNHVVAKRIERVKYDSSPILRCGRILCFYPEYSLNDAMVTEACQEQMNAIHSGTNGRYIDDFDNPPWDNWIHCELKEDRIALYSWVHPELVSFVSTAIATDAYGCLVWAEELEKRLKLVV